MALQIREGTSTLYRDFQRRIARLISSGRHMPLSVVPVFLEWIDYLEENNIPDTYWKERMRWVLTHELKETKTLEEKKNLIELRAREAIEQYQKDLN